MVWLRQSRQWSRAPTPAHSLWRLQRHSVEQFRPTKPKWQRQWSGSTQEPFTQPWAHTGRHSPVTLRGREGSGQGRAGAELALTKLTPAVPSPLCRSLPTAPLPGAPHQIHNLALHDLAPWINPTTITPRTASFHPAVAHAPSLTAPYTLLLQSVRPSSPDPSPGPSLAVASLVHEVACLAAALITVGLVMAVLCVIAVMVPVCTLVLRGAGQEGPGGPRTPARQP